MQGRPTPKRPPTQIKAQFAQTISGQLVQIVPSFPFKMSRKQAERVCANCLCKLFLFGWVLFWGVSPSSLEEGLDCFLGGANFWLFSVCFHRVIQVTFTSKRSKELLRYCWPFAKNSDKSQKRGRREGPGNPFRDFFSDFGPKGRMTPVNGQQYQTSFKNGKEKTLQSLLFGGEELQKKRRGSPPKRKGVFLSAEPLKPLEKRAKTRKRKENRKTKKARKTKKGRIGRSGQGKAEIRAFERPAWSCSALDCFRRWRRRAPSARRRWQA